MSKYKVKPLSPGGLKTYSLKSRKDKVNINNFAQILGKEKSFTRFVRSLPNILAGKDYKEFISLMGKLSGGGWNPTFIQKLKIAIRMDVGGLIIAFLGLLFTFVPHPIAIILGFFAAWGGFFLTLKPDIFDGKTALSYIEEIVAVACVVVSTINLIVLAQQEEWIP